MFYGGLFLVMIKIFFYLFSFLTITLILIINPNKSASTNFTYQSKVLNIKSNQLFLQKFVVFSVFIFFICIVNLLL